jgi:hypothetical protein
MLRDDFVSLLYLWYLRTRFMLDVTNTYTKWTISTPFTLGGMGLKRQLRRILHLAAPEAFLRAPRMLLGPL